MPFLFYIVPILLFLIFFMIERRTVWIGFFFLMLTGYLLTLTIVYLEFFHQKIVLTIVVILVALIILLIPLYVLSFIIAFITSGIRLIKREGRKLHNFLSLTFGLFIIAWVIAINFISIPEELPFLYSVSFLVSTTITYMMVVMISFAIAALLNQFRNPWKTYDYIIVLGSGIIGDRVPPLLASRIDKGIALFHTFHTQDHPVKLIFTGGQGGDELLPEGVAMAKYAQEKGIEEAHIIIEDKAVNTYENLLFSKQLIDQDLEKENKPNKPNILTVTNNFHVFRSLLWAKKVGVRCDGAGSKTKFYFWINALIREFIGVLYMQRTFHIAMFILIFITAIVVYIMTKFYVLPFKMPT
ncbi:YdcF family protein [Pseudogracilibacillus sp. ICA-222130]|uniref:YdcF family protein n=1 Tax=Pseudogracilibacillus sp. ICA-222130 TaxID=3134655 RepID=UPI0030C01450